MRSPDDTYELGVSTNDHNFTEVTFACFSQENFNHYTELISPS